MVDEESVIIIQMGLLKVLTNGSAAWRLFKVNPGIDERSLSHQLKTLCMKRINSMA